MSEQQQADAGKRVAAFLQEEAVKNAFIDLERQYFAAFKKAMTAADREQLHARITALDDLFTSLLGTVDSGKLAQRNIDVREKNEAKRTPRPR